MVLTQALDELLGTADETLQVAIVGGIVSILTLIIGAIAKYLTGEDRKEAKSAAIIATRSAKAARADAQTIKAQIGTIHALEERVQILEDLVKEIRDAWAREKEEWRQEKEETQVALVAASNLEKDYSHRIQSLESKVGELSS